MEMAADYEYAVMPGDGSCRIWRQSMTFDRQTTSERISSMTGNVEPATVTVLVQHLVA